MASEISNVSRELTSVTRFQAILSSYNTFPHTTDKNPRMIISHDDCHFFLIRNCKTLSKVGKTYIGNHHIFILFDCSSHWMLCHKFSTKTRSPAGSQSRDQTAERSGIS